MYKRQELLRAEQIIRPTGLLDPEISVRPVEGQIDDLISEVNKETSAHHKVLITTLTKRMAEDLTDYMREAGIRVKYLHSDIDTLERAQIIRDMRLDVFDVLVGINLLREGLDIPEITLAVSYTHLDVYKRQWFPGPNLKAFVECAGNIHLPPLSLLMVHLQNVGSLLLSTPGSCTGYWDY